MVANTKPVHVLENIKLQFMTDFNKKPLGDDFEYFWCKQKKLTWRIMHSTDFCEIKKLRLIQYV